MESPHLLVPGQAPAVPIPSGTDTLPLAIALRDLAAWLKCLEGQAHLVHVNYTGANFIEVHGYLKERYLEHLEQLDSVLEAMRTLRYWVPAEVMAGPACAPGFEDYCTREPREMLMIYRGNIEALGNRVKDVEAVATEARSLDVANLMADLCGQAWKVHWFLSAVLGEEG